MCVQYWPASIDLEEAYGPIIIKIVQEEELANFRIRTFKIYKKELDVSKPHRAVCLNFLPQHSWTSKTNLPQRSGVHTSFRLPVLAGFYCRR